MSKKDTHRMRNVNLKFKFRKWTDSLMNTVRQQQQPSATMATREKWKTVKKGTAIRTNEKEKNKAGKRQYKGNRAHIHQEDETKNGRLTPEPHEPVNNFSNSMPTMLYSEEYRRIRQFAVWRRRRWRWWLVANDDISQKTGKLNQFVSQTELCTSFSLSSSSSHSPVSFNSSSIFVEVRDVSSFLLRMFVALCVFVRCTGFTGAWARDMLMHCTLLLGEIFGNYFLRSVVSGLHFFLCFSLRHLKSRHGFFCMQMKSCLCVRCETANMRMPRRWCENDICIFRIIKKDFFERLPMLLFRCHHLAFVGLFALSSMEDNDLTIHQFIHGKYSVRKEGKAKSIITTVLDHHCNLKQGKKWKAWKSARVHTLHTYLSANWAQSPPTFIVNVCVLFGSSPNMKSHSLAHPHNSWMNP